MRTLTLVAVLAAAFMTVSASDTQSSILTRHGHHYRIFHKSSYQILDTAYFYIYSHEQLVQGMKIARSATVYYFSTDVNGPVEPLTIQNLEKAFAGNKEFCYRLHTDFYSEKDLMTWLPTLKTYKIKYAYGQSSK